MSKELKKAATVSLTKTSHRGRDNSEANGFQFQVPTTYGLMHFAIRETSVQDFSWDFSGVLLRKPLKVLSF